MTTQEYLTIKIVEAKIKEGAPVPPDWMSAYEKIIKQAG